MWNYKHFDNYMASKLFKIQRSSSLSKAKKKEKEAARAGGNDLKFINPTRFCNIMYYLINLLPQRCQCCHKTRKQRGIDRALHLMQQEINIVETVKSRRFFRSAMKLLLSREQRLSLREHSNYILIDPSDSEHDEDYYLNKPLSRFERLNQFNLKSDDGFDDISINQSQASVIT